ncbi:MAG: SRPBCC family protein [Gemmatimonadota bacterium]
MIRWIALGVGGLIALTLLVALIGFSLPQDHVAQSRARLSQPPDSVWALVRDMATYPSWWSQLSSSEREVGASGETWIQEGPRVGRLPIHIESEEPPHRLVTRIGEGLPFGGRWTYEISPAGGGATLTVTEDGEIYNPIYRFVSRFLMGYHGTMDSYLVDLGRLFGEEVTPEHVPSGAGA